MSPCRASCAFDRLPIHAMSELVETAPAERCCLRLLVPRPGAGDLFEARRLERAGGEGVGR